MLLSISLFQISCTKEDDKAVALPTVSTNSVTNIAPTTVTTGGVISDNVEITARGVCYSSSNQNPSLEDDDGFTTDGTGDGSFVSNPSGLLNGTTYYIRAYATNTIGTAYGNMVTCKTVQ